MEDHKISVIRKERKRVCTVDIHTYTGFSRDINRAETARMNYQLRLSSDQLERGLRMAEKG